MRKLMLVLVVIIISIIGYKLIDNYNHAYIPTFTDAENEIICIEEGIE